MKKNSKLKIQNSKILRTQNPKLKVTAFLWDESFLWGLMAYKALISNNLAFRLIRSEDIRNGCLKNYSMLFVPGGWSSNKLKSLGDKGANAIRDFVNKGGSYLGFCGGAGLATLDGIGLLRINRMPTKQRVPSFSGRIHLKINKHPIWNCFENSEIKNSESNISPVTHHSSPVFYAWWPPQFVIDDNEVEILATYGDALPDSFSSDINVGDIGSTIEWTDLEKIYQINLDPARLTDEPAVVEGKYGKGRVVLSLVHFDTPDDENGAMVLKNLWEYLNGSRKLSVTSNETPYKFPVASNLKYNSLLANNKLFAHYSPLINDLESAVDDLISLGIRNFLWFWRNQMLLQWRRGVRGLEYCTLYLMIKEIAEIIRTADTEQREEKLIDELNNIKTLLIPFVEKAKQLLILERLEMQNSHITYEKCDDPEIQKIRSEIFGNSKSYGGLFKKLIDGIDKVLYPLLKL